MAKKEEFYPASPVHIDKTTWFYIERKGLCLVHETRDERGTLVVSSIVNLPWSKLERAFTTYRRIKARTEKKRVRL